MSQRSTQHAAFTLERSYPAAPDRVFAAWANVDAKARWFTGPPGEWKVLKRELEFRIGGREHVSGAWAGGKVSRFDARYFDIVPNARIVYAYEMHIDTPGSRSPWPPSSSSRPAAGPGCGSPSRGRSWTDTTTPARGSKARRRCWSGSEPR